jgi:mannose-6-phosphate isomerase-like protein (cupin superfamily)
METTFKIESFPFARSILHAGSNGSASVLQPPFMKDELGRLDGHLLSAFPFASARDAHSDMWEMHPLGDEVLFLLTGELGVDYSDGPNTGSVSLQGGSGVVMPRGVWHRLVFRGPCLLLALTAAQGTQARADAGGRK